MQPFYVIKFACLCEARQRRELFLTWVTALIATANWLRARRHPLELERKTNAVTTPL